MSGKPIPVVFAPIFKPKPWGGRKLASLLGKSLPSVLARGADARDAAATEIPIGESWELVSLPGDGSHPGDGSNPGDDSRVRDGPLRGKTLSDLVSLWGRDLLGDVELIDGRFPLLIKFLDARENLSVQVHPKPPSGVSASSRSDPSPAIKHEAWYILDADPGAELLIGLHDGVTPADLARLADTPRVADLIRRWPAKPGQCYYLPSGTVHALGAGVVVAEIQTPSDVTYRLFDWGRTDRELHIRQALENVRYDVSPAEILQPRRHVASVHSTATRLTVTERFMVEKIRLREGVTQPLAPGDMAVWIILSGTGALHHSRRDGPSEPRTEVRGPTRAESRSEPRTEGRGPTRAESPSEPRTEVMGPTRAESPSEPPTEGRGPARPERLGSTAAPDGRHALVLSKGDVALIPAGCTDLQFEALTSVEWLEVRIPVLGDLARLSARPDHPRPAPEPPPPRDGLVPLTHHGRPQ